MVKLGTNEIIQFFEISILAVADYLEIDKIGKVTETIYDDISIVNPQLYSKLHTFISTYWNYQCEVIKLDEMELNNSQGINAQKIVLQIAIGDRNTKREILINAMKN